MSLKRRIFNLFAAVVMVFGSMPITFASTYADEPAGIVPEEENKTPVDGRSYETDGQSFGPVHRQQSSGKTGWELDQELHQSLLKLHKN